MVCNAGSRCLSIVSLQDGSIVRRIPVDGVPTGICYLGNHRDAVAISVQGRAESGASINGVANPTDRVEVYPLNDTEWNAVGEGKEIWSESGRAAFSYPNGIDVRRCGRLVVADWNNHRENEPFALFWTPLPCFGLH